MPKTNISRLARAVQERSALSYVQALSFVEQAETQAGFPPHSDREAQIEWLLARVGKPLGSNKLPLSWHSHYNLTFSQAVLKGEEEEGLYKAWVINRGESLPTNVEIEKILKEGGTTKQLVWSVWPIIRDVAKKLVSGLKVSEELAKDLELALVYEVATYLVKEDVEGFGSDPIYWKVVSKSLAKTVMEECLSESFKGVQPVKQRGGYEKLEALKTQQAELADALFAEERRKLPGLLPEGVLGLRLTFRPGVQYDGARLQVAHSEDEDFDYDDDEELATELKRQAEVLGQLVEVVGSKAHKLVAANDNWESYIDILIPANSEKRLKVIDIWT